MKKLSLLSAGVIYACILSAQPSFQTSLQAGISLPLNSNDVNDTHAGQAIHFGNSLDYTFGNRKVRFGLGAYIGYINSISTDNKYKETGEAIAEKYGFQSSLLTFNSSSFKSAHILLGPVASFGSDKFNFNIWAKGGYGLNEPSRYSVVSKENGAVNNIYSNQAGENKNGLAYSAGAGIKLAISEYVGLQLSAGYFSTQTDQVNYNFDREKGTKPLYYTASNQFIQASAGLQFSIGNPRKKNNGSMSQMNGADNAEVARMDQKIKTKSNIKNDRIVNPYPVTEMEERQINKSKSNVKNNRILNETNNDAADNDDTDSLLFTPQKIELRSMVSDGVNRIPLQSVDNYLTGFLYKTSNGTVLNQCGSGAMDSDPIPGVDVHLKRVGSTGNDLLSTRTNKDGSFAFNNIAPGNYIAEAGSDKMDVSVNAGNSDVFKTLDVMGGSCGDTKQNYIISAGDKTYVEVIAPRDAASGLATGKKHVANIKWSDLSVVTPRDAASGLATGKRMHKPYLTSNMDFDINQENIVTNDGKIYAEVINAREASSGMASGRRTIVTGDVDGDGLDDNAIVSPRDAASGLPTGKRMHKPYVITKELDYATNEIVSPRDAASGLPTGKRMHKPFVVTIDVDDNANAIVSPRDAASGLPTGKRMHKPFVVTIDADEDANEIVSPRDAASGLPTGKRMHKPYIIQINPDENSYEVLSPRDAANGLSTGRMHKPFVITKELNVNDNGDEITTYKIIHRDLAARNVLLDDVGEQKGIITGKDNDHGINAQEDVAVTNNPLYKGNEGTALNPLFEQNDVKNNPLYQPHGTQGTNPLNARTSVSENPLYEASGSKGENPLFEAKSDLRVLGTNGKAHDIFIPSNIIVVLPVNDPPTEYTSYDVGPIKWMAPEAISEKSINEKGIKRSEAAKKGINQSGIKMSQDKAEANSERKGWDGTVKGGSKNINTSEDNIGTGVAAKSINEKGIKRSENVIVRGWDPETKGGASVKSISRVRCADGTCAVEAIVIVNGAEYEAVITGVLKTKHDTAKNSISNIR